jgi:hypothetical protein
VFIGILEILILDVCLVLLVIFIAWRVTLYLWGKYYAWKYARVDKRIKERDKKYGGGE